MIRRWIKLASENLVAPPLNILDIRGFDTLQIFSELILAIHVNGKQSRLAAEMTKVS